MNPFEWLRPQPAARQRAYAGAQVNRLTADWQALGSSADTELLTGLRVLRARSRELVRDNDYAKNAVRIIKNNVVGTGIGLQAQVQTAGGQLIDRINNQIETAWEDWCDKRICHTAGKLHFHDIERLIVGELATAGEVLLRKVRRPFGGGSIPFALEVIEADRLIDQWSSVRADNGNMIRMGVEQDEWGRPMAYWLHPSHPGDYQFTSFVPSRFVRVPADEILHLYVVDRWPQSRGEPWFHTTIKRLYNMGGYEEAEIVAARASANIYGIVKSPEPAAGEDAGYQERLIESAPGEILQLRPGEDFAGFAPSRPNAAMDPFLRLMLRGVAAGIGVSYESLSRDYSQSNYSSSRLALLDDRDLWRVLQGWLIRNVRNEIHRDWLDAAVLAGVVNPPDYFSNPRKYQQVRFRPRGWNWVDPTREVEAFRKAVRSGFMTVGDVVAATGGGADLEDVLKARRRELDMMDRLDLVLDTNPAQVADSGKPVPPAGDDPGKPDASLLADAESDKPEPAE